MGICQLKPKNKRDDEQSHTNKHNQVMPLARTLTKREIKNKYELTRIVLGEGAFGRVLLAENKNDPS